MAIYVFRNGAPEGADWIVAVLVLVLAAWPAIVLFLLAAALQALAELPGRIRASPVQARDRAAEVREVAEAIRRVRGAGVVRLPFLLWRLTRAAGGARELLGPHAGALPLFSVPFLALSAAAIAATFVLVPVALVLALLLAF